MTLTIEQQSALERGEPVRFTEPATHTECVLIRADVYDQVKTMIYHDDPLSPEEKLAAIRHAGERAGWDDPELDVYEQYRKKT